MRDLFKMFRFEFLSYGAGATTYLFSPFVRKRRVFSPPLLTWRTLANVSRLRVSLLRILWSVLFFLPPPNDEARELSIKKGSVFCFHSTNHFIAFLPSPGGGGSVPKRPHLSVRLWYIWRTQTLFSSVLACQRRFFCLSKFVRIDYACLLLWPSTAVSCHEVFFTTIEKVPFFNVFLYTESTVSLLFFSFLKRRYLRDVLYDLFHCYRCLSNFTFLPFQLKLLECIDDSTPEASSFCFHHFLSPIGFSFRVFHFPNIDLQTTKHRTCFNRCFSRAMHV